MLGLQSILHQARFNRELTGTDRTMLSAYIESRCKKQFHDGDKHKQQVPSAGEKSKSLRMGKRLVLLLYLEWGMNCFFIRSENGSLNFAKKLVLLTVCA